MQRKNLTTAMVLMVLLASSVLIVADNADESDAAVQISDFGYSSDKGYSLRINESSAMYSGKTTVSGGASVDSFTVVVNGGYWTAAAGNPLTKGQYSFVLMDFMGGSTVHASTEFTVCAVSYVSNGGVGSMPGVLAGGNYLLPDCGFTAPEGKEFDHWDVNGTAYAAGSSLKIADDVTVKAIWKDAYVPADVVFDCQGLHGNVTVSVNVGDRITDVPTVSAEGYTLVGWYKDTALTQKWNFATDAVEGDMTLYAKWTVDSISFGVNNSEYGTVSVTVVKDVLYKSPITVNGNKVVVDGKTVVATPKTGDANTVYGFDSWTPEGNTVAKANLSFTANFVKNVKYDVVFDTQGLATVPEIPPVDAGSKIAQPAVSAEGYTLVGWYTDAGLSQKWNFATDAVEGDMTLYAKWTVDSISFGVNNAEYGTVSVAVVKDVLYKSPITIVGDKVSVDGKTVIATPKTGDANTTYVFDNWTPEGNTAAKAGLSFTANFVKNVKYDVVFDTQGLATVPEIPPVDAGSKIAQPAVSAEGYTLVGWYTDAELTHKWNFEVDNVDKNMTLYAKWTVDEIEFTVSSDKSYGTVDNAKLTDVPYKAAILVDGNKVTVDGKSVIATPKASDDDFAYTFIGWSSEPVTETAKAGIVFTASFDRSEKVDVMFEAQGLVTAPATQHVVKDTGKAVDPAVSKEGYKLVGWCTDEKLTQLWDFDDTVKSDMTLYAKWTVDKIDFVSSDAVLGNVDKTTVCDVPYKAVVYVNGGVLTVNGVSVHGTATITDDLTVTEVQWMVGDVSADGYVVLANTEITAVFDVTHYVKFKITSGGECVEDMTQMVKYGQKASAPEEPSLDMMEFDKWLVEGTGMAWNFDDPVEKGMVLYATWKEMFSISVTGNYGGSYSIDDEDGIVVKGTDVTLTVSAAPGFSILSVLDNSVAVAVPANGVVVIEDVEANHSIVVTFIQIFTPGDDDENNGGDEPIVPPYKPNQPEVNPNTPSDDSDEESKKIVAICAAVVVAAAVSLLAMFAVRKN